MIRGSCLCGALTWRYDGVPDHATACNCTACRRYGVLWAYGHDGVDVHVEGPVNAYARGEWLTFDSCPTCGCLAAWRGLQPEPDGRIRAAVNLRLAEPADVAAIPIHHLDGLDTFEKLPLDGRCVADLWY